MKLKKIIFTKMVATGNDFIVIDQRKDLFIKEKDLSKAAAILCDRRNGIGGDGALILETSKKCDLKMRIFNADGTEAEMCGNGLRCASSYVFKNIKRSKNKLSVEALAGIYIAEAVSPDSIKIKMEDPKDARLGMLIKLSDRSIRVNYIDTGVPHTVIFVHGLKDIDVDMLGRGIRYHKKFKPRGTNVDFVEVVDDKNIKMRTYERGVEGETPACGTGAVASAAVFSSILKLSTKEIAVDTKGGVLRIYLERTKDKIKDVYLEGEVNSVFKGVIDL
ncbi:MAG: diaminopimelate epimerase [Candidatus Omnitrophota bacterium]